jgi:uncharacterized membrane protein/protein-disulfide isomerase
MSKNSKNLTLDGYNIKHMLLILSSIAMIIISYLLIKHYFNIFYPEGLEVKSFCETGTFFSCDSAVFSPVSAIFGIPIALFGFLMGVFLLAGSIIPTENLERTNHFLSILNFIGCIVLLIYSLVMLRQLCPYCTLYYIVSAVVFFLFYKYSDLNKPIFKVLATYAGIAILASLIILLAENKKEEKVKKMIPSVIANYQDKPFIGDPETSSSLVNHAGTKNFKDAKIRLSIFSDFECPYCIMLATSMSKLAAKYRDSACNPDVERTAHPNACKASYLSYCLKENFDTIHDQIFEMDITSSNLDKFAKKHNVSECMNSNETRESIMSLIKAANPFNIRATPTMILNGRKLDGALPLPALIALIDTIIENER